MKEEFVRTALIYGSDAIDKLKSSRVAVFGIGGVGGYVVEALARSGVGTLDIIDNDKVSITNINRQIIATHSSIGRYKVDVAKERLLDINPDMTVNAYKTFFLPENEDEFDFSLYDYVVDAIDTVAGKLSLVEKADKTNTPIISSMGAGNKTNPTLFSVADINKTTICPLARVMRKELKARGIKRLKVVYSTEKPKEPDKELLDELMKKEETTKRSIPGSTAFVPSCVGLIIAGELINDLLKEDI
ncbi:MAG: tRNA threonylcarbamoyladenosine dehydratase [Lachnospiraceae bacterium]|nr:tRNA threonylcarbamoyladenosine dehydratase [Lachnospiraceae bacterium]